MGQGFFRKRHGLDLLSGTRQIADAHGRAFRNTRFLASHDHGNIERLGSRQAQGNAFCFNGHDVLGFQFDAALHDDFSQTRYNLGD